MHKFGASGLQLALAREYFYNSNYGNQKGKNIYVRIGARARTFASGSGPCDHAEPHALLSPSSFVFFVPRALSRSRTSEYLPGEIRARDAYICIHRGSDLKGQSRRGRGREREKATAPDAGSAIKFFVSVEL